MRSAVMKRGALAVVALAIAAFSAHAQSPDLPGPTLLFNPFSGEVISENRAGEPWYPASLTKLMTAYVIFNKIKDGKLKLDQPLTISELAHSQPASHIGLPAGQTVTVDFALQALLVYSANDMAYVLAEGADGSVDAFAKEMNDVARKMGLQASHFVNPNGLFDPRHISSARDMGVIAALIINQFPEHLHYFNQEAVQVGKRKLANHNSLIRIMPEAVGMKTGFICNSGYNLVGSAVRDGQQLVSVVLGAKGSAQRAAASKAMLDEGFDQIGKTGHGKIGEIVDQPFGQIVPADMTPIVCKQKDPVAPVNAHHLHDFGISFGTYETAVKADAALRGRLISPVGIDAGGQAGVIKLDNGAGFAAMVWGLTQQASTDLCSQYNAENAPCDVMPDTLLQQMAASAPAEEDQTAGPADQGSDTAAAGDVKANPAADAPPEKPAAKAKHKRSPLRKSKKKH